MDSESPALSDAINLDARSSVAQIKDYDVRFVKLKGEFVWHKHDDTDDFFLVLKRTPDDFAARPQRRAR
jgi:hypothetical protein